jgi:hypothetical protein
VSRGALCLAAAGLLLAGCATYGPATVPTQDRSGQSWVITRPLVAAQVLDTCSRDSPGRHPGEVTGFWAPSRQQIDQLEAALHKLQPVIATPTKSDRQYVGIESDGHRLIYINAFYLADHSDLDPGRAAIRVCDGGSAFWGAIYDPQSGEFSQVETNGPR